jgi:hypothetical protein
MIFGLGNDVLNSQHGEAIDVHIIDAHFVSGKGLIMQTNHWVVSAHLMHWILRPCLWRPTDPWSYPN